MGEALWTGFGFVFENMYLVSSETAWLRNGVSAMGCNPTLESFSGVRPAGFYDAW
jgi:hypothetical protein